MGLLRKLQAFFSGLSAGTTSENKIIELKSYLHMAEKLAQSLSLDVPAEEFSDVNRIAVLAYKERAVRVPESDRAAFYAGFRSEVERALKYPDWLVRFTAIALIDDNPGGWVGSKNSDGTVTLSQIPGPFSNQSAWIREVVMPLTRDEDNRVKAAAEKILDKYKK